MALLLVRHGQASFGSADYDNLSERGGEQCARLGAWLGRSGLGYARVVIGAMRRHRQSFDALAGAYGSALPTPEVDPGLDEFDHHSVIETFMATCPDHPDVQALVTARHDPRAVLGMIRQALGLWSRGELDGVTETWRDFQDRVRAAGQRLRTVAQDGPVLVVTSGGVISQLVQAAMEAPDHRAIELNLAIRNSALTEITPDPAGLRLLSWNGLPHLADARDLWTHF